jgi:hypothetical protein
MNRGRLLVVLLLSLSCFAASCDSEQPGGPTVTVSPDRAPSQTYIDVRGRGFTPNANVMSHLREPDGREFPVLPILTDAEGEFTHEIDTLLLAPGTHELWVVDDASNVSSNIARFEVTKDQPE